MSVIQILAISLFLIICFFLVILILLQSGKGGSLGLIGGGASHTPFGSSSIDIITRVTWYFLIAFFSTAILAAILFAEGVPEVPEELTNPIPNQIPSTNGTEGAQEPGP